MSVRRTAACSAFRWARSSLTWPGESSAAARRINAPSSMRRTSKTWRASSTLGRATRAPRPGSRVTSWSRLSWLSAWRTSVRETLKMSAIFCSASLVPGMRRRSTMAETIESAMRRVMSLAAGSALRRERDAAARMTRSWAAGGDIGRLALPVKVYTLLSGSQAWAALRRLHGETDDARARHGQRLSGRRHVRRAASHRERRNEADQGRRPQRRWPRRCALARGRGTPPRALSPRLRRGGVFRGARHGARRAAFPRRGAARFRYRIGRAALPRAPAHEPVGLLHVPRQLKARRGPAVYKMDAYWLDWANLLLRGAHVITGIAWIGASFYFVGLDNSLTPPADLADHARGIGGELWAVHGGGFYHQQKYPVSPARLPEHLHWSMWESYSTWLTGFALFTVLYLFNASTFLIDKAVFDWSPGAAVATALAFFVAFWLIYDGICRLFGERRNGDVLVGVLVFAFI